jgi:ABC-type uncharacterized transport system substrate-binding protein
MVFLRLSTQTVQLLVRSLVPLRSGLGANEMAFAQTPNNAPRIGVLVSASPPHPFVEALTRGLRNLGYTDGQNIVLEVRYSDGRSDRAAELAAELVRLKVDLIVAHFTQATKATMAATRTIPIVMAPAGAPLQMGFVDSLAHPGGNVTGLSAMDAVIGGRRLQLLRELLPGLNCVAVLGTTPATDPYSGPFIEDLRSAALSADAARGLKMTRRRHQLSPAQRQLNPLAHAALLLEHAMEDGIASSVA